MRRINVFVPVLAHRFAPRRLKALEPGGRDDREGAPPRCSLSASITPAARRWRQALEHPRGRPGGRFLRRVGARRPAQRRGRQGHGGEGHRHQARLPQPLTDEVIRAADVVVTMGCGDACPFYPGKRYLDWELDDPAGRPRGRPTQSATTSTRASGPDRRARPRRELRTCRWADSSAGQPYQAPGRDQRMVTAVEREPTDSTGWSSVPALRRVRASGVHDEDRGRLVGRTPGRAGRRDRGDPPAARRPQPRGAALPWRDRRQAEDGDRPRLQGGRRAGVLTRTTSAIGGSASCTGRDARGRRSAGSSVSAS